MDRITRKTQRQKGFTLIELTFVISIFAIMASVVLFSFKSFGAKTALDNLAQDIALRIVGAQKAAASGALTPGLLGFDAASAPSYGVFFTSGVTPNPADQEFTYFADLNHNGFFNSLGSCPSSPTGSNECLSVTGITTGDYIDRICYRYPLGSDPAHVLCDIGGSAHITFKRPFRDAVMFGCTSPGACASPVVADVTAVELASGADPDLFESIFVTSLGEVRVATGSLCYTMPGACPP